MKLFAPGYYPKFHCIADRCRHSCCIGWEIDVDGDTLKKYQGLSEEGYGKQVKESIDLLPTPHFRLDGRERCPHLNEKGLCRLILALGEDHLCHICREHPRFYNRTPRGLEVGLGMACEEACRLILTEEDYVASVELAPLPSEEIPPPRPFDPLLHRATVYAVLSDAALPYPRRLRLIGRKYRVSPRRYAASFWRELFASLEYMEDAHREWYRCYTPSPDLPREVEALLERTLAYLIRRHCAEAESLAEWRASLGLCLVTERFLASAVAAERAFDLDAFASLARAFSEELEYSEENTDALRLAFS